MNSTQSDDEAHIMLPGERPKFILCIASDLERNRTLVGRTVFKTAEGRRTSLVGSTPTPFRQIVVSRPGRRSFVSAAAPDRAPGERVK